MTEYEVAEIAQGMSANIIALTTQQNDVIGIYVSIVFAFIAASHVTGKELSKVRTTVATGLFCVVCFWLVWRITQLGLGINYMQDMVATHLNEQNIPTDQLWRDGIGGGLRVLFTVSVWSLGMVGGLVFLWDIRHRDTG